MSKPLKDPPAGEPHDHENHETDAGLFDDLETGGPVEPGEAPSLLNGHDTEPAIPKLRVVPELVAEDPFDPENVRLTGDEVHGAEKVYLTVPVQRPRGADFFRVHKTIRVDTSLLAHEREMFLLAPRLRGLVGEALPYTLFFCLNRSGGISLWPVRLPGKDGRSNAWWEAARSAAQIAETKWVRLWANLGANSYDAVVATANIAEPTWPDLDLRGVLALAFKDKYLATPDHPILRRLRGEI